MAKLKYIFLLFLVLTIFSGLFSCRSQTVSTKKSIVVTYSILGSIVKELIGDKANVTVSIPNGLDPHEWEPSARDIETINKADLVIENGLGLEAGMEKTLQIAKDNGVRFFTATDYITVRHVGPGEGIPSGDPDQVLGAPDPHFWMDPLSMVSIITALTPVLSNELNLDVSSQASSLKNRLNNLNTEVTNILTAVPAEDRNLVTGHESMGYFAQRYGFQLIGVIIPSLSTQASVSAANLAILITVIQKNQVKAIFTELGTSQASANTISQDTGVKVVELTTHVLPADGSYFTFMTNVANTISNALK